MNIERDYPITLNLNQIYYGDCIEFLPDIPSGSVDMILQDPPYNKTDCEYEQDIMPMIEQLWVQWQRIIKPKGAILFTAREPFTSKLIISNLNRYKHKWVWNKKQCGSYQLAKYMPLQIEEDIIVFSWGKVNYYPIMRKGKLRVRGGRRSKNESAGGLGIGYSNISDLYYPTNIIEFSNSANRRSNIHPMQKPVALFEYLIRTYTNEGDIVFDGFSGSGTTAIACLNTGRNYICVEKDFNYWMKSVNRVGEWETEHMAEDKT